MRRYKMFINHSELKLIIEWGEALENQIGLFNKKDLELLNKIRKKINIKEMGKKK